MDFKIIIYIVILIGYYVYKFIKKQQANANRSAMEESDNKEIKSVFETSSLPMAVKPGKQQVKTASLDDLLKEFVIKEPTPLEVYEKPREIFLSEKRGENIATYENPDTNVQVETYISRSKPVSTIKKAGNYSRFEEISAKSNRRKLNNIKFTRSEIKKAFIYAEIFRTKF